MYNFGILDPDPHKNLSESETLVAEPLRGFLNLTAPATEPRLEP